MIEEKINKKLKKIFSKIFKINNNNYNLTHKNCHEWDSIKHFDLINEIEKNFKFKISINETIKLNSFNYIKKFISKKLNF